MIAHGINPIRWHWSDYDFHRTFGTVNTLPWDLNVDLGLTMPDQNARNEMFNFPALPQGCTGYTQAELCQDADRVLYDPSFTYRKTLLMENKVGDQGCDIRDSLSSTIVFGVRAQGETDAQAMQRHRGQYFNVTAAPDFFSGIRSAVTLNRRSVSMGSPWFPEWHRIGPDGIMPMPYLPKLSFFGGILSALGIALGSYYDTLQWHNYKCSGFTTLNTKGQPIRNGEIFLMIKSWQGPKFGDAGWCYMPVDVTNAVFAVPGTGAFTLAKADPSNIKNVQFNVQQVLNALLLRLPKPTIMNEQKLYNAAKAALGHHKTLNDSVAPEVGCAEAWSAVAKEGGVQGIPTSGFAGTEQVWQFVRSNSQFEKIDTPEPGATVISPTGHGNGSVRGHVGILAMYDLMYAGDWGICSNDSNSGLFREQWSLKEWQKYYGDAGKLPVDIYRFKG